MERESARLKTLIDLGVLDTSPERAYDDVTRMASIICQTPMACISLIDEKRQWFKSRIGIDEPETPRELSFCAHAIKEPAQLMIVRDATQDDRFAQHPGVTGEPGIRFYAGVPLVASNGHAIGTICVVDTVPRELDPEQIECLRHLSQQIVMAMETRRSPTIGGSWVRKKEHLALAALR